VTTKHVARSAGKVQKRTKLKKGSPHGSELCRTDQRIPGFPDSRIPGFPDSRISAADGKGVRTVSRFV
jgi:hypothetical protein